MQHCKSIKLHVFMFPAINRYSCSHGNSGPSYRGNRDYCGLAKLDGGLPPAQTRGTGNFYQKKKKKLKQKTCFCFLCILSNVIYRCRSWYMRSCAQYWRADTLNTATDTDFRSSALWSVRCSGLGQSPLWQYHTEPSETAGQPAHNK